MSPDKLPPFFDNWRILWCPEPVDIGFHPPYEHASQWVGMNLLMLDERTAIVEQSQLPLIRMLEQEGITVIPIPLRHARTPERRRRIASRWICIATERVQRKRHHRSSHAQARPNIPVHP